MNSRLVFVYDGECPFCNHFAELIELKSGLTDITIVNGRKELHILEELYKQGYDLNNGAILIKDESILHGSSAINWICSQLKKPSDPLLEFLRLIFSSKKQTNLLFPLLLWARRTILIIKGVSLKPINITT